MARKEKSRIYRGGLHVFPKLKESKIDQAATEAIRATFLEVARGLDDPNQSAMARSLGILRDRVARLLRDPQLDLKPEYIKIVNDKKAERAEARAKAKASTEAA